jgi:integrase
VYWDSTMPGFGLMVTAAGHRSFIVQYRANGISRRLTINGALHLTAARKQAKVVLGAVAQGGDPLTESRKQKAQASNTLHAVAEEYFTREGKKLRSTNERRGVFRRYIFPRFGARSIDSIRRSEIVRLLDHIEDNHGPVAAQHTLAGLRRVFNWHAGRSDDFRSPIVRGMSRIKPGERERTRILDDDELRIIWRVAEAHAGPYDRLVQFILVTATRLREASDIQRDELNGAGEWVIPAARYKGKRDHLIPLSQAARAVLAKLPVIGRRGWFFTTNGEVPISGFSKAKRQFDERVLEELRKRDPKARPLPRWTTHDLRRTARSLMSRAGVEPDHAERALGHVIGGIRGTYDRHQWKDEKRRAFEMLAQQIARILDPQDNIVTLRARGQGDA